MRRSGPPRQRSRTRSLPRPARRPSRDRRPRGTGVDAPPRTRFMSFMASPEVDEWASSTITANRLPATEPANSATTGNFCSVVMMIRAVLPGERGPQLRGVLVDLHDRSGRVRESGDGRLQLPVQHHSVGDDDDLVEDRLVDIQPGILDRVGQLAVPGRGVKPGQLMGGPGDGVRLARPGRVAGSGGSSRDRPAVSRLATGGRRPTGGTSGTAWSSRPSCSPQRRTHRRHARTRPASSATRRAARPAPTGRQCRTRPGWRGCRRRPCARRRLSLG